MKNNLNINIINVKNRSLPFNEEYCATIYKKDGIVFALHKVNAELIPYMELEEISSYDFDKTINISKLKKDLKKNGWTIIIDND